MDVQIPEHVTWKKLDNEIVILDLRNSNYYTLNKTASTIWREILEKKKAEEIIAQMLNEFDCDEDTCRADVHEQFKFLLKEGLIDRVDK